MSGLLNAIINFDKCAVESVVAIHNSFLDFVMPKITMLGDAGIFWIVIALVLAIIPKTRRCGIALCLALVFIAIFGNIFIKNFFARSRPFWNIPDISLLIKPPVDFSFPSGHTYISFASAAVISHYYKKWSIAAFILAAMIAFSRFYLQVHYPTDILFGIIFGLICGFTGYRIIDRVYNNKKTDEK